jgi:hypothetical protein
VEGLSIGRLTRPGSLASGDLQPPSAAHLPPLEQNNMSCGRGTLLSVSQWESDKEGRSFGGARRMNAATQTAGQFADNRQPSAAPERFRRRAIVTDPALYDVAYKHQFHPQFWISNVELRMSRHIGQQLGYNQPKLPAAFAFKPQIVR